MNIAIIICKQAFTELENFLVNLYGIQYNPEHQGART